MKNSIFDHHTHIGQFYDTYYEPHTVMEVMSECGVAGCLFSSTTSCLAWKTEVEKKIIVSHIRDEVNEALETAARLNFDARALCWIIPQRYFDGESVAAMVTECSYNGFKIHPRMHDWNLQDERVCSLIDDICEYTANQVSSSYSTNQTACETSQSTDLLFPILIHCGDDEFEKPIKFERWFEDFPQVQFVLAHSRPLSDTLDMLQKYTNVFCDTAFVSSETVATIRDAGFKERTLFGTDFPITHYWSTHKISEQTEQEEGGMIIAGKDELLRAYRNDSYSIF